MKIRFSKLLIRALGVTFFLTLMLQIWMVNRLSSFGDKLNQIKADQKQVELQNIILENSIAKLSSLETVEKQALVLGFMETKDVAFLKSQSVALVKDPH